MHTSRTAARRWAAIAAVAALGIVGVAGPASAATRTFGDARGDMTQGADLRRVRVVDGAERLTISVVHRNLVRSPRSGSSLSVFLDTDPRRTGPEFVFTGGTFEGTDYALLRARGFQAVGSRQVPLHGGSYRMTVDYVRDVARIDIDQVVLGNPDRVRVEVKTGAEVRSPDGSGTTPVVDWLGAARRFTPWVPRG